MAERPSVKEILELARKGGPVKPASETPAEAPASAPEPEVEAEAAAEAEPAPTPASLGRPLTLQEKLAAARAGGAPKPAAAAKPKPAAKAAPAAEAAAEPPAPAAPVPSPAELGRPLTLQEKLAAARGGAAGGAKPAAGAKPAGAKPAAAAAKPAAAARALPPLAEITDPTDLAEAARRAAAEQEKALKAAKAPAAKAAPASKVAPSKAVPPKPSRENVAAARPSRSVAGRAADMSRRAFVALSSWVVVGWAAFVAGTTALTVMTVRFLFPNVLAEPPSTIKVGAPGDFEKGEVNERWKAEWGFWMVRSDYYDGLDKIYAIQSVCTHLGCPPNWLAGEQKFKCPCHGSGFYISGVNFEGPAPRPLERFKLTLGDDGSIVVDKSQKFQEELGQWKDPDSFIPV